MKFSREDGLPKDWVVVLGACITLPIMYGLGYLFIDVFHLIDVNTWQAGHIDGVRIFAGGFVLAIPAMLISLWITRRPE